MNNPWNNLDAKTKEKLVKEVASAGFQIAAIIATFATGKKIEQHYATEKTETEKETKKKFWQK